MQGVRLYVCDSWLVIIVVVVVVVVVVRVATCTCSSIVTIGTYDSRVVNLQV